MRKFASVVALLRELGIRVIVYIDDLLIMSDSLEKARNHTLAVMFLLGLILGSLNFYRESSSLH